MRVLSIFACARLCAAMSASLSAFPPSPAPVGTSIGLTAGVGDAASGTLWYRFRICLENSSSCVLEDFGPENYFEWAPAEREGTYVAEATIRNLDTGESATQTSSYEVQPRAISEPVVSPTNHALVFLYSAPPCESGRMRVMFRAAEGAPHYTPYKACTAGVSMNFYLAGMRASTEYTVQHMVDTGFGTALGPTLSLTTGRVAIEIAPRTVITPGPLPDSQTTLLQASLFEPTVATDLSGAVIWYYTPALSFLTRPETGGEFWGIIEDPTKDPVHQVVRKFDLAGYTILETNAAAINEQLAAQGKRLVGSFHHEARTLPDGKILVLGSVEQILDNVQGTGPVDVIGDMILVLDSNLQVVWTWDAFEHLDPAREAILGQTCSTSGGCPPVYVAPVANDWLHGNSVSLTPDGQLLYSARHQDWVIKIDYRNATGDVLWRMGNAGDFQMQANESLPWFTHQHDAKFEEDGTTMLVFDNGNTRYETDPSAHSRGQVLHVDEQRRVVSFVLNVDLGDYSLALGSAQRLNTGNYHFNAGFLPNSASRAIEVDSSGKLVYAMEAATPLYRSFRMQDLYTP